MQTTVIEYTCDWCGMRENDPNTIGADEGLKNPSRTNWVRLVEHVAIRAYSPVGSVPYNTTTVREYDVCYGCMNKLINTSEQVVYVKELEE